MHCVYSGVAKGTSRAEVVKKSSHIALAIVEMHKSEGIRQAIS